MCGMIPLAGAAQRIEEPQPPVNEDIPPPFDLPAVGTPPSIADGSPSKKTRSTTGAMREL